MIPWQADIHSTRPRGYVALIYWVIDYLLVHCRGTIWCRDANQPSPANPQPDLANDTWTFPYILTRAPSFRSASAHDAMKARGDDNARVFPLRKPQGSRIGTSQMTNQQYGRVKQFHMDNFYFSLRHDISRKASIT
ncbi:hypothetical protein M413DRAFT_276636 [Hebeloma cylindrosporum]|uniref:Uncharacterized protein n=1 Tax=Hebeloma cylindrosporum TaxID=76867 RepID=A0A0C2XHE4_HEBCY|nr:hypothetical protein M413DRAFT_276636 [Hebeloma cylindrosporum h7]